MERVMRPDRLLKISALYGFELVEYMELLNW
jgi:hypothetical protein